MPKAKKRSSRSSSTPGKSKGSNCHRTQMKTRMSLDSRWYKTDPVGYAKACKILDGMKGNSIMSKS